MYRKLFAAALILWMPAVAASETLRCGRYLVDASATVVELLTKCGDPTSRRSEEADVRTRAQTGGMVKIGTSITEYWTYSRGTQAAAMVVIVRDGKIRSIERAPS